MKLPKYHAFLPFVCFAYLIVGDRAMGTDIEPINLNTTTHDHYPAAEFADDGSMWTAWHAYRNGSDQILARRISADGTLDSQQTISTGGTTHGPPTLAVDGESVHVFWTSKIGGRWIVLGRECRAGSWQPTYRLSNSNEDAIHCRAVKIAAGRLLVVWSGHHDQHFQIQGRVVEQGHALPTIAISNNTIDSYRPVPVVDGDEVWVFWDNFANRHYSVLGRVVLPEKSPIEQVSPVGEFCLKPTALARAGRLCVAWLRKIDVIGGPGVISQWHTLHAAERREGAWEMVTTVDGASTGAELTHGLMAQIEPRPVATGGYLGRRTEPLLLADGVQTWLLWERKADHRGSTSTVTGELLGRPFADGKWQESVSFCKTHVDYHIVRPHAVGTKRKATIVASTLPRAGLRTYERFELDLTKTSDFKQKAWSGWSPIELPIASEMTDRFKIEKDGKTYQLFWADLHCHNGLTGDAEGEPDELMQYARDRAQLDVVVFTNNDFYLVPLTQYEFELGNLFAAISSRPGHFLSLPGFEWTSRIPGDRTARLGDPGNWLPPYQNASYPNHRSVIYPPSGGPLVHFTEVGNDISALNNAVEQAGGITLTQHAAFQVSQHPVEVGMELTSGWSNYIGRRPNLFHDPLRRGLRLGFVANGDTHRRAPGLSGALTGIFAERLTAEAIIDALRERRCFATNGSRIRIDSRVGDSLMGEQTTVTANAITIQLKTIGTRPITSATLIRDGEEIHSVVGNGGSEFATHFTDSDVSAGTHWYYWQITQEHPTPELPGNLMAAHGHLAWTSPHWVTVVNPQSRP